MQNMKVELLAPAGSKEAFLGAIHAGADAVYLAGNKYGARAYADNFSEEDLLFAIRYAHIWGRKVYLTVNTLMKERELQELYEYIKPFYEAGLDACIVQDIGAFQCLKIWFPEMELHVSTQMTITGAHSAALLKELGASRIVPARELSLTEIQRMKDETGLEMETFIHGAMCYSYSGQCLFSSILGGRSGNRGRCAQPCRLPYATGNKSNDKKDIYPLSLKDMCTIEHLDALMESGIDSFKIEGRMKKPEYVAGVTAVYRKYMDMKLKNPKQKLYVQKKDLELISNLYIRSERHDGYYFKQNGKEMITLNNPSYSGSDETVLENIRKKYIEYKPKKKVSVEVRVRANEKAFVMMTCEYLCALAEGDIVEKAKNAPITKESIEKQLGKLGDSCFELDELLLDTDNESFYSVKGLNELRRQAVRMLEDMLIEANGLTVRRETTKYNGLIKQIDTDTVPKSQKQKGWTVLLSNEEHLKGFESYLKNGQLQFERVYLESDILLNDTDISDTILKQNIYVALPYCMRHKDEKRIHRLIKIAKERSFAGFLVRNLEEYAFLLQNDYDGKLCADADLYIWNSVSRDFWEKRVEIIHCPIELNRKEWYSLLDGHSMEKLVYGRIPMMITANCIAKTTDHCIHGNGKTGMELTDRYKKHFPVMVDCCYCMNVIFNSVPLSLHKDMEYDGTKYEKKLMFTVETEEEALNVLRFYEKVAQNKTAEAPYKEYTTAHEKRGVE